MGRAMQAVYALNGDRGRAFAFDLRTHGPKTLRQIDDLWFTRGVFQNRRPFGERRGHQDIFSRTDRDEWKLEGRAFQSAVRRRMHIAVAQVEFCAQSFQAAQVQVHRARADGATARQRNDGLTFAGQHRAEDQNGRPHFAHDVIVGDMVRNRLGAQHQNLTVLQHRDLGTERGQQRVHGLDVRQARGIGQRQRCVCQQRGRHQGQAGVFCARDWNLAVQRAVALYQNGIHDCSLYSCFSPPGLRALVCALRRFRLARNCLRRRSSRRAAASAFPERGASGFSVRSDMLALYNIGFAWSRSQLAAKGGLTPAYLPIGRIGHRKLPPAKSSRSVRACTCPIFR